MTDDRDPTSIHLYCCISGTLTVEEVYKDRDQFASLVREVAAPDVGRMGIEILSFTIKDVYDNVTYIASLGESQVSDLDVVFIEIYVITKLIFLPIQSLAEFEIPGQSTVILISFVRDKN